jgi:chemosensory pili system protein ChpA (sensor histidine kinase/response regulator)
MNLARDFENPEPDEPAAPDSTQGSFDPAHSVFAAGAAEQDRAPDTGDADEEPEMGLEAELLELEAAAEHESPAESDIDAGQDGDIIGIFLEEADEVLGRADTLLHQWRDDLGELRFVRHLQREIHTFKGGARMSALMGVGDYSHAMETLLEHIAEGRLEPSMEGVQLLEDACDRLHRWVEQVSAGKQPASDAALAKFELQSRALLIPPPAQPTEVADEEALLPEREVHELPEDPTVLAEERTDDSGASAQVRVDSELLDKLVNAAGEVSIFRSRLEQQVGGLRSNLGEFDETL